MSDRTTLAGPRWSWRCGRLHVALFRATNGVWTRDGETRAFGAYAPIPGRPIADGTKSAALVLRAWLLAFFWEPSLTWEDTSEEGAPGQFWELRRGDCLVGEVYPRGDHFRWHCKLSDWRQMEDTAEAAKTNLLASVKKEIARAYGAESGKQS